MQKLEPEIDFPDWKFLCMIEDIRLMQRLVGNNR